MNENMNGQPNVQPAINPVGATPMVQPAGMPQQPVAPTPAVQPAAPPQPMIIQQPAMPGPVPVAGPAPAGTAKSLQAQLRNLDAETIKKYTGIACGVLMVLAVFLPYLKVKSAYLSSSVSIWDNSTLLGIVFILLGIITAATFFLQKVKQLSYIGAGAALCFVVLMYDSLDGLGSLSFGFWFLLLATIGLLVVNIMDDLKDIKTLFAVSSAVTPLPHAPAMTPIGMQPVSTAPLPSVGAPAAMQQPMPTPSAPAVQTVPVCGNCGQPQKNPTDQFCQTCGQRY